MEHKLLSREQGEVSVWQKNWLNILTFWGQYRDVYLHPPHSREEIMGFPPCCCISDKGRVESRSSSSYKTISITILAPKEVIGICKQAKDTCCIKIRWLTFLHENVNIFRVPE